MSKLTALLKKRKSLIATGSKAFAEAAKVDEEINELIERAQAIFGGEESSKPRKSVRERALELEVEETFKPVFRPKTAGRVPSLQEPIREVLEKNNNEPMSQDEILSALVNKGVTVKGKRPKHTLSAHVSYLIKKEVLVRTEKDRIALKQALLVPPRNAARTH